MVVFDVSNGQELETEAFKEAIETQGCALVKGVLPNDFIKRAKFELESAIRKEVEYHGTTNYSDYGMVILCSLYGGTFFELFEIDALIEPFNIMLGEGCTVYAYTSSSMPPQNKNFSCRIHVDCPRIIPNYITNMGATILLDDFTETNGATYFLPGSQLRAAPPTEEEFFNTAKRLIAPAGSVWYFNARTWHAGGQNWSNSWRHGLTINMGRPWMKQRIDIPRAMSHLDISGVSEKVLQKLGFHSQVPANYNEYYVAPEKRKFKQKYE